MDKFKHASIIGMLKHTASQYPKINAVGYKREGEYKYLTYDKYFDRVLMAARGLKKVGIKKGDRLAIFSETRLGWTISDMATQAIGSVTVPIYNTNTAEQAEYIINHSGSKLVFVSDRFQYEKLMKIRDKIPQVELVVSFERFLGDKSLPLVTLHQLSEISEPLNEKERKELESGIDSIKLEDVFTIMYTSGTTADPKGVVLAHKNIMANTHYIKKELGDVLEPGDVMLTFLPLSHVLGRTAAYYLVVHEAGCIAFAESVDTVAANLVETKPHLMVSVPRLFEKVYARVNDSVHEMKGIKKKLFHWALKQGKKYAKDYEKTGGKNKITFSYKIANKLVFGKLKSKIGADRLKCFVSGGAPLDKTINEFFWSLNIAVLEGYGLTETSPVLSVNTFDKIRFGSVGCLVEETKLKVLEDGELLFKGPQIFSEYYKNKELTKEVFDEDGWFLSGDIGHLDEDGYLFITDRKKELIVTAAGKNIAPQPIENMLKLNKYIESSFLFGDKKPYLVAIITPDIERLIELAKIKKINYMDLQDLVKSEKVKEFFSKQIEEVNSSLPRYSTIKKFVLLPHDFTIDGGELTPTLKIKRRVISDKYREEIESLYDK